MAELRIFKFFVMTVSETTFLSIWQITWHNFTNVYITFSTKCKEAEKKQEDKSNFFYRIVTRNEQDETLGKPGKRIQQERSKFNRGFV